MAAARSERPFGDEVRRLLAENAMSLRALAARIGVDPGFLVRVLQGKQPPSKKLLAGVSVVFDLPSDYFLEIRREHLFELLSRNPSLLDTVYRQAAEAQSPTGAARPGDIEPLALDAILSADAEDPEATRSAAAAIFRYRRDEAFRSAVDSRLPEIEGLARTLGITAEWTDPLRTTGRGPRG